MFGLFKRKKAGAADSERAVKLFREGKFEAALELADSIINANPDVALSHRFRGEVLFSMGQHEASIEAFECAEQIGGPGIEEVFFWRALAHANAGRLDEAVSVLRAYKDTEGASPELVQKCEDAIARMEADRP